MAIEWTEAALRTQRVEREMFGTNMLFDRDQIGQDGTFDDSMRALGISDVRFPGGSITEWYFDINDPDATLVWAPDRNAWREVMPLSEFLTWAGAQDVGVNLVVPTGSLIAEGQPGNRQVKATAEADLYRYFTDVLGGKYGTATIETFEIGNEYWLGAGLNHVEYARIANLMAETAQRAIDDHRTREGLGAEWEEPDISIQIGQYGRHSTTPGWVQNRQLIEWLTPEAAAAVDAVVVHYYTRGGYDEIDTFGYYFDRLDDWANDPRLSDIEFHVTEWNVNNQLSSELGLKQASALWFMFSEMVVRGVDAAHVWPIQQNNKTNLSGNEGQTDLTIAGEAFRLLSDAVVGSELTRRTEWEDGAAWVYEGDGVTHVYIASRSDRTETFTLDKAEIGLQGQTWWKTILGTTGAADDHTASPTLEMRADLARGADQVAIELDPFEVVRATFYDSTLPAGPGMAFPDAMIGSAAADYIATSDLATRAEGGGGDDVIVGGGGADVLYGDSGNDHLQGNGGADVLVGGTGRDVLEGGDGNDTLYATAGDRLEGGGGDDVFVIAPAGVADPLGADLLWT
ncbi:MAG: hypothetical protein AAGB05_13905 [Pseudomonadota bacterium]